MDVRSNAKRIPYRGFLCRGSGGHTQKGRNHDRGDRHRTDQSGLFQGPAASRVDHSAYDHRAAFRGQFKSGARTAAGGIMGTFGRQQNMDLHTKKWAQIS